MYGLTGSLELAICIGLSKFLIDILRMINFFYNSNNSQQIREKTKINWGYAFSLTVIITLLVGYTIFSTITRFGDLKIIIPIDNNYIICMSVVYMVAISIAGIANMLRIYERLTTKKIIRPAQPKHYKKPPQGIKAIILVLLALCAVTCWVISGYLKQIARDTLVAVAG